VSSRTAAGAPPRMAAADLGLRLVLEVGALVGAVVVATRLVDGVVGLLLGALWAACAATAWVTFATLDDPSRSGRAPVPVGGPVRLAVEFVVLVPPVVGLVVTGRLGAGLVLGAALVLHQATGRARLRWLWRQRVRPSGAVGGPVRPVTG
jgi:hypothetical protein